LKKTIFGLIIALFICSIASVSSASSIYMSNILAPGFRWEIKSTDLAYADISVGPGSNVSAVYFTAPDFIFDPKFNNFCTGTKTYARFSFDNNGNRLNMINIGIKELTYDQFKACKEYIFGVFGKPAVVWKNGNEFSWQDGNPMQIGTHNVDYREWINGSDYTIELNYLISTQSFNIQ